MSVKPLVLVALLAAGCSAAAPPPSFTASLTSPTDVVLTWPDDADGHRVEYPNDPAGPWTTLRFLPPHTTSFHHPDLIPETPFYYREQPFTGPVSTELHTTSSGGTTTFTWADRSSDEAGFLLEIRRRALHYGPLLPVVHLTTGKER